MIIPLLHRVLLKLDSVEEVTESGIIISKTLVDKERKAIEMGTVVSIGDQAFKDFGGDATTIAVGDRVVIARYSGKEVTDGDEKYILVNDDDVLCITKDEKWTK